MYKCTYMIDYIFIVKMAQMCLIIYIFQNNLFLLLLKISRLSHLSNKMYFLFAVKLLLPKRKLSSSSNLLCSLQWHYLFIFMLISTNLFDYLKAVNKNKMKRIQQKMQLQNSIKKRTRFAHQIRIESIAFCYTIYRKARFKIPIHINH